MTYSLTTQLELLIDQPSSLGAYDQDAQRERKRAETFSPTSAPIVRNL